MDSDEEQAISPNDKIPENSDLGKSLKRFFLSLFLLLFLVIGSGIGLAYYYQDQVKGFIIEQLNRQLKTKVAVDPRNINFSVLRNFPSASLEFCKVLALNPLTSAEGDTLFSAGAISLQFNLMDIFHRNYRIKKLALSDLILKISIDAHGNDNCHFWKASGDSSSGNFAFALNAISLKHVSIIYSDLQKKQYYVFKIPAGNLNGKFSGSESELGADLELYIGRVKLGDILYMEGGKAELKSDFSIRTEENPSAKILEIRKSKIILNEQHFELNGSVEFNASATLFNLKISGNKLDLGSCLELVPEAYRDKFKDYSGEGDLTCKAFIKGESSSLVSPVINVDFDLDHAKIKDAKNRLTIREVNLKGDFNNANQSTLKINEFSGKLNDGSLKGNLSLRNFDDPLLNLKLNADIDLADLPGFFRLDTIQSMQGRGVIDLSFKGKIPKGKDGKRVVREDFKNAESSGTLELRNLSLRIKNNKQSFENMNGSFQFNNSDLTISNFHGIISKSDFSLKGKFSNLLPWFFIEKEDLGIEANLSSEQIDLDELLMDDTKTSRRDTVYELSFPEHLVLDLRCSINDIRFNHFEARALNGRVSLEGKKMRIGPVSFNTMDGKISGTAEADENNRGNFLVTCHAILDKVNISKLFNELENFGQKTMTDKNLRGYLSADIEFTSVWSSRLVVDPDKIKANADLKIEKGELVNFEPMKAFSKFINVKDLEDIRFETLENQIEIKNRTIFIPKMDIKNSALNLTCSGKHYFDNEIDYHIRLLMRELLAKKAGRAKSENEEFGEVADDGMSRTLFISMSGTVDHPVIRYDKKGMFQKIREDIKKEKQNLKDIFREEFGWFKKDSAQTAPTKKEELQKKSGFKVKWDESEKNEEMKNEE